MTPQNPSVNEAPSSLRVLLVDDDPVVLLILSEYLKGIGTSVVKALTADEALYTLFTDTYDLLITDQCMPDMSGDSLIDAVRKEQPNIKAILLSGRNAPPHHKADTFLLKPFKQQDLEAVIQSLFPERSVRL